jgi:mannose-6-phosphate isomerase
VIAKLSSTEYEKVWGAPETEPWYRNPARRKIGEIWFSASDSVPLLVKLLFTSDNLSVQVHPADEYAKAHHNSRGKTEMWHILRAEPDARIALGLRKSLQPPQLRDAALSGEIVDLLNWIPVRAGNTFFVPAGTIHAIGGGIVLCEVQQHSDITYRLYDYDRAPRRELHLDHAMAVSNLEAQNPAAAGLPVSSGYFLTDRFEVKGSKRVESQATKIYIALEGHGSFGGQDFQAGDAFEVTEPFEIASPNAAFLVTEAR